MIPNDHPAPPEFTGIWRDDFRARAMYAEGAGIYRVIPRAIAIPATTRALQALLAWAQETRTPLIPRGAGSAMSGSSVGNGVIVDCTALDGAALVIDPERKRARTGPGTTIGALNESAGRAGLRMPVEPSSARWATAGGVLATNASGAASVAFGSVRAWVDGITVLAGNGELLTLRRSELLASEGIPARFGRSLAPRIRAESSRISSAFPRVRKNSSGYALDQYLASGDLLDLIVGSEGTLGFITSAVWRLAPVPAARLGLRAALRQPDDLARLVPALLGLAPSAVEFLDATFLRFVADDLAKVPDGSVLARAGAVLMVELEGDDLGDLDRRLDLAHGIVADASLGVSLARDAREAESLWEIRHAASPRLAALGDGRRSLQVIEDGVVPVAQLAEYLTLVRAAATSRGVEVVLFGHAGDGNVHANLLVDLSRPDYLEQMEGVFREVTRGLLTLGGSPSGEHGDGRLRGGTLEQVYGPELIGLFRELKALFDPEGILNPDTKLGADAPFERLKVGDGAEPLPPDLEQALRRIERGAGYVWDRLAIADDVPGVA
ncbi:MAG: FAD-binding oxidoreductase [Gemmatimonadota bacterium]